MKQEPVSNKTKKTKTKILQYIPIVGAGGQLRVKFSPCKHNLRLKYIYIGSRKVDDTLTIPGLGKAMIEGFLGFPSQSVSKEK